MRKLLAICAFVAAATPAVSQDARTILDGINKIGENELIENAVKEGFVYVNTYYALENKDNGRKYGRDSHDYYGSLCYLGYAVNGGYITMAEAAMPWEADSDYDDFRNDEKYSPVLLDSIYVRLTDGSGKVKARMGNTIADLDETGLVFLTSEQQDENRFVTTGEEAEKGWLVMAMLPKGKNTLDRKTPLAYTSKALTVQPGAKQQLVAAPKREETIVGGVFVVPVYKAVGQVELQARGFLTKSGEDGKWKLSFYTPGWMPKAVAAEPEVEEGVGEEVVPVEENGEEPFALPDNGKKKNKKKPSLNRLD